MSVEAMLAAHKLSSRTSHACYRVLMCLAEHAGSDGRNAWPSIDTMALEAQADEKTVRRALAKLVEDGLIVGDKKRGRGNVTVWHLAFPVPKLNAEASAPAPTKEGTTPGIEDDKAGTTPGFTTGKAGILPVKADILPIIPGTTPPEPVLNLSRTEEKESEVPPPAAARPDPRGSRLPPDWMASSVDRAYAVEHGLNADRVEQRFRNHWIAKAGAAGRMCDWAATWRNWCLRDADGPPRHGRPGMATPARRPATNGSTEMLIQEMERARRAAHSPTAFHTGVTIDV